MSSRLLQQFLERAMRAAEFQERMSDYRKRIQDLVMKKKWKEVSDLKTEMWEFRDQTLGKVKGEVDTEEQEESHESA